MKLDGTFHFHKHRKAGAGQFDINHSLRMSATYTLDSYLTKRSDEGTLIKRSEKFLQDDLNKFVNGQVSRSDVQILRRGLVKAGGTKQLLGSLGQREVLSKIRSCELKEAPAQCTGEKPLACKQCNYSCTRSSNLKKHMKKHTAKQNK